MKKVLALILAVLMCVAMVACGGTETPDEPVVEDLFTANPGAVLKVMLMPQGDMNESTVAVVTKAVNDRIAELGEDFTVEFLWSGGAWGFEALDIAIQTAGEVDIIPAHSWSGSSVYTSSALAGSYIRLDNPEFNLIEKYGNALYSKTSDAIKAAATVPGNQGTGIYAYIVEKDSVSQLGYLVNETVLNEIGYQLSDFEAIKSDLAAWDEMLAAFKAKYPNDYPLNIEGEVLERAVNNIAYVQNPSGPLAIFMADDPAKTNVEISSRYESDKYKAFTETMQAFYAAGYVNPDLGIPGETSSSCYSTNRDAGTYLFCTFVYAPGAENDMDTKADAAQGKDVSIKWAPSNVPVGTSETAQGTGLAVYAGSKSVIESVKFLNMLASDTIIADLVSEGVTGTATVSEEVDEEGKTKIVRTFSDGASNAIIDGIMWRSGDRAGWNIWRYGVVGANSAATPLGDVEPNGKEWTNFRAWNADSVALDSTGWLFDATPVKAAYDNCYAVVAKYAVPLGTGASSDYDSLISELQAAGIDEVVAEAQAQYEAFAAAQ